MIAQRRIWVIGTALVLALWFWWSEAPEAPETRPPAMSGQAPVQSGQSTALTVLDVAERTLDDRPALAVVVSVPLDAKQHLDSFFEVLAGQTPVSGAWVVGESQRIVYFPHVLPETQYIVRVRRGLPAADGHTLAAATEHTVTTRKITPAAGFASKGSILPPALSEGLPIMSVNVPDVDVEFLRVKPDKLPAFLSAYHQGPGRLYYYDMQRLSQFTESVYMARFATGGEPNKRTIAHLPVKDIKELQQPGLYIAVLRVPNRFTFDVMATFFSVSDIGVHVRAYAQALDVYASSLKTAAPMPDVSVEIFDAAGKGVQKLFSDREGYVHFPFKPEPQHVVVATQQQQVTLLSFREPALDLSEFDVKGTAQQELSVFMYSGRDLYRPGDTAQLSLLLRNQDGQPVKAQPLELTLKRPDNQEHRKLTLTPDEFGYVSAALPLPVNAPTGVWNAEVRTDPSGLPVATRVVRVEEFLPERLKLDVTSAQLQLARDEPLQVAIDAAYLYGAPAANNRVTATLTTAPAPHGVPHFADYFFGDINEAQQIVRSDVLDATLSNEGKHSLTLQPVNQRYQSLVNVRLTTSVYESGGRPVTRSLERIVWPAAAVIGLRPVYSGDYAERDRPAEFEIIKTTPTGALIAAKDLEAKVVREDRDYHWSYAEGRGWFMDFSESQYPILVQSLSIPEGQRAKLTVPVQHGAYRIEIRDPETGLLTRYRFYAGWNWEEKDKAKVARPDRVAVSLDKPDYAVGEMLRAQIVPPHAGEAIVLVESDHRLWHERMTVPAAGATVEIPLAAEWGHRHDIYLSVVMLRPGNAQDKLTPTRAVGVAHVKWRRDERKFTVAVEAPAKAEPEQTLPVTIHIDGAAKQRVRVTVSAVDVGILNITNFVTPNPFDYFFGKRRYAVDNYDIYGKVIEILGGKKAQLRFGGDADTSSLSRSKRGQAEVRLVELFSGAVDVDATGTARVELPLPDFNGTLRVMAVAFSADHYGAAEREVTVAAPIVAEAALPRFLSPGDDTVVALDVHNLSGADEALAVELKTSAPLRTGVQRTTISLADGAKMTLRFPLQADAAFGVGNVDVSITGRRSTLHRHFELNVRPAYPGITRQQRARVEPGQTLAFDKSLLRDVLASTLDASLVISDRPPLDVRAATRHLLSYPYGCLEQTTSSAFPLLYIDEKVAADLELKPLSRDERTKRLNVAFERLQTMQNPSGGFSLWDNRGREEVWLTPYVVDFLLEARERGFAVPEPMLQRALESLLRWVQGAVPLTVAEFYSDAPEHLQFAAQAYAAYVLARVQRAPLSALRNLWDHGRQNAMSGLPLLHLGLALQLQGDSARANEAIAAALKTTRDARRYLGDYGSDIRDAAMMVALLARHNITTEQGGALHFALSDALRQRQYFSTQESMAVMLAGMALPAGTTPWLGRLVLNGQDIALNQNSAWRKVISAEQLLAGPTIQGQDKPLYVAFSVNGYSATAPAPERDRLQITRTWYDMKGQPLGARALASGELVMAHINVTSRVNIDQGLVIDLLPAGLEIENANLSQGERLSDLTIAGIKPADAMTNSDIRFQEYRDDRYVAAVRLHDYDALSLFYLARVVSPGAFIVPSPYVEDMYRPEIRGIGAAADVLTVK